MDCNNEIIRNGFCRKLWDILNPCNWKWRWGKKNYSVTVREQERTEQVTELFGNSKMNQCGNSLDGNPDREVRELVNVGHTTFDHVKGGSWEKINKEDKERNERNRD